MISELHKKVLTALGFEVIHEKADTVHVANYDSVLEEFYIREAWVLAKDGQSLMGLNPFKPKTEADAWAQAPTLDALMTPLMAVICDDNTPFWIVTVKLVDGWYCRLRSTDDSEKLDGRGDTPAHAVAALFLTAVESGLVDPKAVVL